MQGMTKEAVYVPVQPQGPGSSAWDSQLRTPESSPLCWLSRGWLARQAEGQAAEGSCGKKRVSPVNATQKEQLHNKANSNKARASLTSPLRCSHFYRVYLTIFLLLLLMSGSCRKQLAPARWLRAAILHALAIKQLHLHAKKLLVWSRIRHCICLPFRFSWSFAFSHKPIFLIILGYICNSACKMKNNLTSSHTLPIKQNSAIRLNIVGRWNELMSEKAKYHLLCIKTILI